MLKFQLIYIKKEINTMLYSNVSMRQVLLKIIIFISLVVQTTKKYISHVHI